MNHEQALAPLPSLSLALVQVETKYTAEEVKAAFKVSIRSVRSIQLPRKVRGLLATQIFEGAAPKDHVRVADLVENLMKFGEKALTKEQATELVSQLEPDGNGLVNYADFVNMMLTK